MNVVRVLMCLVLFASIATGDDRYVNDTLQFEMSVPNPGKISGVYQQCFFYLPAEDGFAANVNLQLQEFAGTLDQYRELSENQFRQAKLKIIVSNVKAGVFTTEYSGTLANQNLHWYARAFQKGGMVYLVTATSLEARWKVQGPILSKSVDSFRLK